MLIGTQVTYQLRPPLITRFDVDAYIPFCILLESRGIPMGAIYGAHAPLQSIFTLYRMGILVNRARARKSGQDEPLPPEPEDICPPPFLNPWLESNQRGAVFRPPALPIKLQGHIKPPDAVGGYEVGLLGSRPAEAGGGPQPVREEKRKNEKWQGLRPAYIISHT